jgi:hypothetical protein
MHKKQNKWQLLKKTVALLATHISIICFVTAVNINAADMNQTSMMFIDQNASPVLTKNYIEANSSEVNVSKYNTKDWEAQFNKTGLSSSSIIGNTMSLFGNGASGKLAVTGDLSKMKTSELQNNPAFATNKAIGAYDSVLQSVVMNDVVNNAFGKTATKSKQIKCYVTRNIGQTYICTAPNNSLMMSSGMGGREAMSKLKSNCEGQCFTQSSCIDMQTNEQNITSPFASQSATLTKNTPTFSFTISVMNNLTINTIDFNETAKDYGIKYTITYVDLKGKNVTLIENLLSTNGSLQNYSLYLGDIASSVTITLTLAPPYVDAISANITLGGIKINYNSNSQYVCPTVQDITNLNPGDFGNLCSSGKGTTLTKTNGSISKTYKICANSIYPGQNIDGSFYQLHACESVCRRQYECKLLPGGSINFEGLKGFQEGCIENTSLSCNNFNEDCKAARLDPEAKVVNELVFGGNLRPVTTIINGITTGIERPRLSISTLSPILGVNGGTYAPNDTEFENERKEEWKDAAYADMMKNANWNVTVPTVGENTSANNVYGINLKSGSFYGFAGTSVRALMWRLKPAAFDVGNGQAFKLYAVLRTIVQNYRYDDGGSGVKRPFYDEIWYVKSSDTDTFVPFYYDKDAYEIMNMSADFNLSIPSYQAKTTHTASYSTFDGTSWNILSPSDPAESFKNEDFSATNAYWEYELLGNMEGKYDVLPGIIRSIKKVGDYNEIPQYTGVRDYASAGTIVKLTAAVGYSNTPLTYQNVKEMVDNGALSTIYETGSENMFPRYFRGDGAKDNNIAIYIYGQQSNGSAYFNIRPRADHVGKKGFIYVYGE